MFFNTEVKFKMKKDNIVNLHLGDETVHSLPVLCSNHE